MTWCCPIVLSVEMHFWKPSCFRSPGLIYTNKAKHRKRIVLHAPKTNQRVHLLPIQMNYRVNANVNQTMNVVFIPTRCRSVNHVRVEQIVQHAMAWCCRNCLLCLGIIVPTHHLYHAVKVIRHPPQFLTLKSDVVLWIRIQQCRYATPQVVLTCNVLKGKSTKNK